LEHCLEGALEEGDDAGGSREAERSICEDFEAGVEGKVEHSLGIQVLQTGNAAANANRERHRRLPLTVFGDSSLVLAAPTGYSAGPAPLSEPNNIAVLCRLCEWRVESGM
jgi:hypothetical protein